MKASFNRDQRTSIAFRVQFVGSNRSAYAIIQEMEAQLNRHHWQDRMNGLIGLWLVICPWAMQSALPADTALAGTTAWSFWATGVLLAGLIILFAYNALEEWINLGIGAWLVLSPWVVGFASATALTWNAVVSGGLIILLAASALIFGRGREIPQR